MIYFGGSFDPWHKGHQIILDNLLKLDEVTVGVSYNPFKNKGMLNLKDRVKLIKKNNHVKVIIAPKFIVKYLIDNNIDKIAVGSDTWNDILKWKDIDQLNIEILIIPREGCPLKNHKFKHIKYRILNIKTPNISSTELRIKSMDK